MGQKSTESTTETCYWCRSCCQWSATLPMKWLFVFQQFSASAHCAGDQVDLSSNETLVMFINPDMWPTNSSYLNPVDYSIWGVMQQYIYTYHVSMRRVGYSDLLRHGMNASTWLVWNPSCPKLTNVFKTIHLLCETMQLRLDKRSTSAFQTSAVTLSGVTTKLVTSAWE